LKRLFHILIGFFLLIIIARCAKIGSPSGGPRDETPPRVEKSKPLNKSVNFTGSRIEITFDEYINTGEISQELIVSPPFEERPEIRLRGKTLIIEWEGEIRDSTTYTFSFGESLKDLNEGNILHNYEFVFSTGGYIDSLSIIGTVLKSFDLKPHDENVFLMLYSNLSDSAPLLEVPDYVGKADGSGNFLINNLRAASYRLFALQDQNRNYKYDIPEEYIGFLDSAIHLSPALFEDLLDDKVGPPWQRNSDTLAWGFTGDSALLALPDSISVFQDSALVALPDSIPVFRDTSAFSMMDSVIMEGEDSLTLEDIAPWSVFVDVFLFQEDNTPQYLIDNTRKDRRRLEMRFNRRVTDTVLLEPYDFSPEGDWFIFEEHIMNDTFVYWLVDSLVYQKDSLTFLATYQVTDSLLNYVPFHDTLRFNFREAAKKTSRRRKEKDEEPGEEEEKIEISVQIQGSGAQDLHRPLILVVQHPVGQTDVSRISLSKREDTLLIPVDFNLVHDHVKLRRYFMDVDWEGPSDYELSIFPGAFTDIYGLSNDTIINSFKVRDPEYYGRILLNLSGVEGQKIIQVLDSKDAPFRIMITDSDGLYEFDYMPPSSFTLKLIHDSNSNGKWDTGEYLEHLQPESVQFHPEKINIRSNFDMEVNWDINAKED
jgi:uncharacterized protein (DUF2141 family)